MRAQRGSPPATAPSATRRDTEEHRYGKVYDARVMRRLWPFMAPYTRSLLVASLYMLGVAGSHLLAPYLVKLGLDRYIAHGELSGLTVLVWLYTGNAIAGWLMQYHQALLLERMAQRLMLDLRQALFTHLMRLDLSFYDRYAVGRLMSRVQNDVGNLQDLFTSGVLGTLGDFLTLGGILVVMLSMHPMLTLVTFAVVPPMVLLTSYWRTQSRQAFGQVRRALAQVNAGLQENISGVRVIQSLCSEAANLRRFEQANQLHLQANLVSSRLSAVLLPSIELLSVVGIALVVVWGGPLVLDGVLSAGSLVAFVLYIQRFFEPIRDLGFRWNNLQMAMAAGEHIIEILDTEITIPEDPHPVSLAPMRGAVEFQHVTFAYQPGMPVLQDFSLTIPAGQSLAIVGHTGAGKTTLVNLVARFYDVTEGAILIDGVDIRRLAQEHLRQHIGIVLQEPFLFSGTVRDNLRYGHPTASDATIVAAAQAIGAHDFIQRLPQGYETEVRERGSLLSHGQRQLLSFVRALLADPCLLILDEATSSIDAETERLVQAGLATLLHGRTALIIAHRLSTIKHADRIIVLDQGRLVENGTHAELLQQRGLYYRLYAMTYTSLALETL
ncbi:MAG: ABC transporter ATP-binding protein [Candidatus Tectomicrobia bacterium]|uniref:ABC transporter ATP-binding protein n=1 Tax=Tectimicrobiota bacterium TaxID=2528274 RepID=A0A937VYF5_UNCTE|nr:ABC transporter ATP-binding protein [Candidatus Tectomicrobia bacterium]